MKNKLAPVLILLALSGTVLAKPNDIHLRDASASDCGRCIPVTYAGHDGELRTQVADVNRYGRSSAIPRRAAAANVASGTEPDALDRRGRG